ncbi:MAG: lysophospholipid acyltransferase family protein [Polyangiaceae bacterium]
MSGTRRDAFPLVSRARDVRAALRTDGPFWRGLASGGVTHAPDVLLRTVPPVFAAAFALALPEVRARVRGNLRRIVGARGYREEMVDVFRTFSHFASCFTEALAIGAPEPREAQCRVEGAEHLETAIARRRGVIAVTAHTGAWEAAGPLLKKALGVDMLIVMEREPDERARRIQDEMRERSGVRIAHVGTEPLEILPLFTHLRRGGVLGVQLDRAPSAMRSLPVRLFDGEGRVPSGPFWLARATGAPIVPVFAYREGHFRYVIEISPPRVVPRDASDDLLGATAQDVATEMERFLRAHPTHWFHFAPEVPGRGPV